MPRVMCFNPLNGDSAFSFVDPNDFIQTKERIYSFLRQNICDCEPQPDLVVAAERKGMRILKDFARELGTDIEIISDLDLETKVLIGRHVLVFDDSIHTGNKIMSIMEKISQMSPSSIRRASIMTNVEAESRIVIAYADVPSTVCQNEFSSYEEQYEVYQNWFLTFLSGIIVKGNPDYPVLHLRIVEKDAEDLMKELSEILYRDFSACEDYPVESLSDLRGCASRTFVLENCGICVPEQFRQMVEDELAKVRCLVVDERDGADLHIVPMLSPRYDNGGCDRNRGNGWCLKGDSSSNELCGLCVPRATNLNFLKVFERNLEKEMKNMGGRIAHRECFEPSLGRHLKASGL